MLVSSSYITLSMLRTTCLTKKALLPGFDLFGAFPIQNALEK